MAKTKRAEYPDSDHPLYTPDVDAQRQVVERIRQAKTGTRRKRPMNYTNKRGVLVLGEYAPMGEHPRVSDELIGSAWGLKQSRAQMLVTHPEKINPWQAEQLCDLLGVTLDWLRGWTDENAYGRYETPDMVADLYERLGAEDKEHLCYMLKRLLGDEQVTEVKERHLAARLDSWLERHPDEAERIREAEKSMLEAVNLYHAEIETAYKTELEAAAEEIRRTVADMGHSFAAVLPDESQERGDSVEP